MVDLAKPAVKIAQKVLSLLKGGKADEITTSMYEQADKNYLFENYDLPTDAASRRSRALDQGFNLDKSRYHGGFSDIESIAPLDDIKYENNPEGTYGTNSYSGPGLYTSDIASDASENYARVDGPDVRAAISNEIDQFLDIEEFENSPANFMWDQMSLSEIKDLKKILNHNSITDRGSNSTVLDPDDIDAVINKYEALVKKESNNYITNGDFEKFEELVENLFETQLGSSGSSFPPGFAQALAERRVTNNNSGQVLKVVDRVENPVSIRGENATFLEGGPPKQDVANYISEAEQEIKRSAYADEIEYREAVQERAQELAFEMENQFEPEGPAVDLIESVLDQLDENYMYKGQYDQIRGSLYERMYEDEGISIEDIENILKGNYDGDGDEDSAAIILNRAYRAAGFDAIDMESPRKVFHFGPSGATHRVELEPSKVRVPTAMFDPRLKNLPNLTAGVIGGASLGALGQVGEEDGKGGS
tara:strand:- start:1177 stop:2607 length:1431 start_codon:yes stop_codon:yes gene_type:complete